MSTLTIITLVAAVGLAACTSAEEAERERLLTQAQREKEAEGRVERCRTHSFGWCKAHRVSRCTVTPRGELGYECDILGERSGFLIVAKTTCYIPRSCGTETRCVQQAAVLP